MPTHKNELGIDIQVKTDAPEIFKRISECVGDARRAFRAADDSLKPLGSEVARAAQLAEQGKAGFESFVGVIQKAAQSTRAFLIPNGQFVQGIMSAADAIRAAAQAGEKFPSVMMRAALAAQEMKVGYVEGMGRMAEETQAFSDVLNRAQLYAEDVGFSVGRVWEGVNKQFNDTFTDQARLSFEAGKKTFESWQKSIDEGLSGVFATAFTKNTEKTLKSWEKFVESLEATFYQSLGRMASALVQENLLAPLFKLGQEAAGGLLSAGKSLFLGEGGLVTRPTLAVLGEAGPEVVLPLAA